MTHVLSTLFPTPGRAHGIPIKLELVPDFGISQSIQVSKSITVYITMQDYCALKSTISDHQLIFCLSLI